MASLLIAITAPVGIRAADFNLVWQYLPSDELTLIGYHIYYRQHSSVMANPDESVMVYVPLSEAWLDSRTVGHSLEDLLDDTIYYFVVTAVYETDESPMSNEIAAMNGRGIAESNDSAGTPSSGGGGGGACFIGAVVENAPPRSCSVRM